MIKTENLKQKTLFIEKKSLKSSVQFLSSPKQRFVNHNGYFFPN